MLSELDKMCVQAMRENLSLESNPLAGNNFEHHQGPIDTASLDYCFFDDYVELVSTSLVIHLFWSLPRKRLAWAAQTPRL